MNPQTDAFREFAIGRQILIADSIAGSGNAIAGTLVSMGSTAAQISVCRSYSEAMSEIERISPSLVIADYHLEKGCGLDLLQKQRTIRPDLSKSVFVLVTTNTSQSMVARAAEEDVDTFVARPFTPGMLMGSILKAVKAKTDPPEYHRVIERGKKELAAGKTDEAQKTFEYSKTLDPAPALSCFYVGQILDSKKSADAAAAEYTKGLRLNKIHYKCLVGLYENRMTAKKHAEAYDTLKRITQYYPANSKRITEVLRLAIVTQSYEDVERYYRLFMNLGHMDEEMSRYLSAALLICGKHYLQTGSGTRALELFKKAADSSGGRPRILREIVDALAEEGRIKQAGEYLEMFPANARTGVDYHAASLLLLNLTGSASRVITVGRDLISREIYDPLIYQILIKRMQEAGLLEDAESLKKAAAVRYPAQPS